MYRTGHYGAALLAYAPVAFLLVASGSGELAMTGGAIVLLATAMALVIASAEWFRRRDV
ncbi:MAG: hypothetical protein ACOCTH_02300 [Halodesulfurarchaeum sp.]